jgi:hypothetical protein
MTACVTAERCTTACDICPASSPDSLVIARGLHGSRLLAVPPEEALRMSVEAGPAARAALRR